MGPGWPVPVRTQEAQVAPWGQGGQVGSRVPRGPRRPGIPRLSFYPRQVKDKSQTSQSQVKDESLSPVPVKLKIGPGRPGRGAGGPPHPPAKEFSGYFQAWGLAWMSSPRRADHFGRPSTSGDGFWMVSGVRSQTTVGKIYDVDSPCFLAVSEAGTQLRLCYDIDIVGVGEGPDH